MIDHELLWMLLLESGNRKSVAKILVLLPSYTNKQN